VIETMVPELRKLPPGQNVVPYGVSPERCAFDVYDVATQAMSSDYFEIIDGRAVYTSYPFRYVWPSELDLREARLGLGEAGRLMPPPDAGQRPAR